MRLNAYLARAGVASRRRADELIRAGRVRVNGDPGELNTSRRPTRRRRGRRRARSTPAPRTPAPAQAGRSRDHRARSPGPSHRGGAGSVRPARRAGRTSRRGHDGSARPHERRGSGSSSRASALWRAEGVRGRRRWFALPWDARASTHRCRAGGRSDGARGGAAARPAADRAHAPRGTHAPGQADVRGRRPAPCVACTARAMPASISTGLEAGEWRELTAAEVAELRRAVRL